MKTIIDELDLLKKTVNSIIQLNVRKKDLLSFATNLIGKKILDPSNTKEYCQFCFKRKKHKKFRKPKYC